jgi:hypothetical protein
MKVPSIVERIFHKGSKGAFKFKAKTQVGVMLYIVGGGMLIKEAFRVSLSLGFEPLNPDLKAMLFGF